MSARTFAWLALLTAACGSTSPGQLAAFHQPVALVPFVGLTPERPGALFPYLAVANGRTDELRIVDPAGDQVLVSPGRAFPLSVPVLPAPRFLASASLRDGGADLLAVAAVGTVVQILSTWDAVGGPRVVATYDLALGPAPAAGVGSEILCMLGVSSPGTPAGSPPVAPGIPGRALLLLGMSASLGGKGQLVVLEFQRQADGSVLAVHTYRKPLGFDPVSLALSPDGFHLYAATPDDITDFSAAYPPLPGARTVQGVAEIDMSGGVAAALWPVRGLDARVPGAPAGARAPTSLVAVTMVGERLQADPDHFSPPVPRVYAALDRSGCGGVDKPVECGIVTIDPATGALLPDPAPAGAVVPAQRYRAPLLAQDPNLIFTAMAVALPPASGPQQCLTDPVCPVTTTQPLTHLAPASGSRWTTAVAAVGASDGRAYVLDLGRYSAPDDVSLVNDPTERTRVAAAGAYVPPELVSGGVRLGLVVEHPPDFSAPYASYAPADLALAVMVTPGFTRTESWTLEWQGILPGLARVPCVVGLLPVTGEAFGDLYVAMQQDVGGQWWPGPAPTDPRLGIHAADPTIGQAGDPALFALNDDLTTCFKRDTYGNVVPYEEPISEILPPSAAYPKGAFHLPVPRPFPVDPTNPTTPDTPEQCLVRQLTANPTALACQTTIRASGLVLSGSQSGYAGRPLLNRRYNFAWSEESLLTGEQLYLARRARRFYYPSEPACSGPCAGFPEMTDPLAAGPVVGLRPTRVCPSGSTSCGQLVRGTGIGFATASGLVPMSAAPSPTSLPTSVAALDKSQYGGEEVKGAVFYLGYVGDAVLDLVPGNRGYDAQLR